MCLSLLICISNFKRTKQLQQNICNRLYYYFMLSYASYFAFVPNSNSVIDYTLWNENIEC